MNRETFCDIEPAKYFQGEDIPVKQTKAVHLITYPNFLSADDLPSFRCSNLWLLSRRLLHYNRTRF